MALTEGELIQLTRWNTPTVYNGWEQITDRNIARDCFNVEESRDFMPQMGPMVGYAVTIAAQTGNAQAKQQSPDAAVQCYRYIASIPGPKIVVMQDLDKPHCYGACWGEVMAKMHRAFGCIGTITDGAIRDVEWMTAAGFKAIARRLAVGHGNYCPVRWNCPVEVFGVTVQPGQLIHADQHGFLVIPDEDQPRLLEATASMDRLECDTVIAAGTSTAGQTADELIERLCDSRKTFRSAAKSLFGRSGEFGSDDR